MKLREQILKEHSKANCNAIVQWIGNSQQRFDQLFDLFLSKLLKNLDKPGIHNSVKRNTVRLMQDIQIPEKLQGPVMNICFDYISSPDEAVAVKAFALTILENLSKKYPEIRSELKTIIEDRWDYESAAFRARGKKILKGL